MSKGLEYIRDISCLISENYSDKEPLTEEQKLSKNCFLDYCKYIAKELDSLEQIDNAVPSKALECLERVDELQYIDHWESREKEIEIIEQALIKAQEQEKVLNVIFKKPLKSATTINYLKINQIFSDMLDYEHYCLIVKEKIRNTEEEFELLKRWVENETN